MIGSDFLTYVKRKFKRTDKDTEIYQATTDIIADIRLRLKSDEYKEEAYIVGITSLGDYRISLPSDFGHLIGSVTVIDVTNDEPLGVLTKISKQRYDELYQDRLLVDPVDGIPKHFCIYAEQIYLGPVPDSVDYKYQLNYTTEDYTEVDASTALVPFSDKYRNILRAGVLAELHDGLENFEESAYWRQMYLDGVSKIEKSELDNTTAHDNMQYNGI